MKNINASLVTDTVSRLCKEANYYINDDLKDALHCARQKECSATGISVLDTIIENAVIASGDTIAICQDTGMAVIYVELGQDVHITGGSLTEAINEGVRKGYESGYLRKSVVRDPIERINTGDNTPAVIHYDIVPGENMKITVAPKGFGSENMSALKMLKPSDGIEGVKKFILDTVIAAGPNPCPPIVVGVGLGGTMEKAALLSKLALMKPLSYESDLEYVRNLKSEMIEKINSSGIGPAGLGGNVTILGMNILTYPTHIAGLPVAVNISCHVTRHKEAVL